MEPSEVGIYLNAEESKVVRITSPYWIPQRPSWMLVTNDPNATLLMIRKLVEEKHLVSDPTAVVWGVIDAT